MKKTTFNPLITIFPDVSSTDKEPHFLPLTEVLEGIRDSEQLQEQITTVRSAKDKKEMSDLKKKLPLAVFSGQCTRRVQSKKGIWSYRTDASVTVHTGIAVLDFDNISADEISDLILDLKADSHLVALFISPSKAGVKALFRVPEDVSMHRSHYRALLKEWEQWNPDPTGINISRACFLSYDPGLHVNLDAEVYTGIVTEPEERKVTVEPNIPDNVLTDFRKMNVAATMIDRAKDGYKHITLLKASYLMGGYIAAGIVKEEDAISMLEDRILARDIDDPKQALQTIRDGIREGKLKPVYEIEDIEKSFEIHLSREEYKDQRRGFSFLIDPKSVDEELYDYVYQGVELGLTTGFPELDEHFRFKENNFNVVLGHDNIGKSTIIWYMAVVSACLHGWKWIIYSPENKTSRIKKQLIDFMIGMESRDVSKETFKQAKEFIDKHFYFIRKDEVYSLYDILDYAKLLVEEDPAIKSLMIDPYNSMALDYKDRGKGLNSYEYHVRAISEIRVFSEKYCTTWVNNHSVTGARRNAFDADGNLKRPQKDDVDQGAIWANRCDDFITIHRKIRDKMEWMWTEWHQDKVKDVETGGRVTYAEEPVKLRFERIGSTIDFVDEDGNNPLSKFRSKFFSRVREVRS